MRLKKIIIVGSGLEGWLTAYILKTQLPFLEIKIINQPILEVNDIQEGTLYLTKNLIEYLDIKDLFQETQGVINFGSRYNNWNTTDEIFVHSNSMNFMKIDEIHWPEKTDDNADQDEIDPNDEVEKFNKTWKRSYLNRLLNDEKKLNFSEITSFFTEDKIPDLDIASLMNLFDNKDRSIAITYTSEKLLPYIKRLALQQDVEVIDDYYQQLIQEEDETIIQVKGTNDVYDCDFVIDCTGIYRDVVTNFSFYNFWLFPTHKVNKVISYESDNAFEKIWKDFYPLSAGYVYQIPLQNCTRYSYVYAQNYISDEDALSELENHLNLKIEKYQIIDLNIGSIDKILNKNCIALGNASSIIEPIFIDPLNLIVKQIESLINILIESDNDTEDDCFSIDEETLMLKTLEFNETYSNFFKEISDLSLLYTWTNKTANFWKDCKNIYNPNSTEITTGIDETMSFKINYWRFFHVYYHTENKLFNFINEYDFLVPVFHNKLYDIEKRKELIQNNDLLDFCSEENYLIAKDLFQQFKEQLLSNSLTIQLYQQKYELASKI
jgi:hypothetical protein